MVNPIVQETARDQAQSILARPDTECSEIDLAIGIANTLLDHGDGELAFDLFAHVIYRQWLYRLPRAERVSIQQLIGRFLPFGPSAPSPIRDARRISHLLHCVGVSQQFEGNLDAAARSFEWGMRHDDSAQRNRRALADVRAFEGRFPESQRLTNIAPDEPLDALARCETRFFSMKTRVFRGGVDSPSDWVSADSAIAEWEAVYEGARQFDLRLKLRLIEHAYGRGPLPTPARGRERERLRKLLNEQPIHRHALATLLHEAAIGQALFALGQLEAARERLIAALKMATRFPIAQEETVLRLTLARISASEETPAALAQTQEWLAPILRQPANHFRPAQVHARLILARKMKDVAPDYSRGLADEVLQLTTLSGGLLFPEATDEARLLLGKDVRAVRRTRWSALKPRLRNAIEHCPGETKQDLARQILRDFQAESPADYQRLVEEDMDIFPGTTAGEARHILAKKLLKALRAERSDARSRPS